MKSYKSQKIYDYLEMLKEKPHIFLSSNTITALADNLNGYMISSNWGISNSDIYRENDPNINEFLYWLRDMPFVNLSRGPHFRDFLLAATNGNEEMAFNLFYLRLEEFKNKCQTKKSEKIE